MKKAFLIIGSLILTSSIYSMPLPDYQGRGMNVEDQYSHPDSTSQRGWGDYFPHYNSKTEEKLEGEIVDLTSRPVQKHSWHELAIILRTEKGTFPVVLGPAWFADGEGNPLRVGEKAKVTGSIFMENGKGYMIAKEVKVGDYKLELRDSNGFPLWSGWRKG